MNKNKAINTIWIPSVTGFTVATIIISFGLFGFSKYTKEGTSWYIKIRLTNTANTKSL